MSTKIDNWMNRIDSVTGSFSAEFGGLAAVQLNSKPNETAWSIAQNIEHLIVINETYYPIIKSIRAETYKTPFLGRISFLVKFFGSTVLKAIQPNRKKKIKTFPIWEPSKSDISGDILRRFEKHQSELKQFIEDCADLILKETVIHSPANKIIVYRLETAFEIMVTHEERHLEQAREIALHH